ncbi:MAG: hypothetical protein ACLS9K_12720 [Lachnospira eligens]
MEVKAITKHRPIISYTVVAYIYTTQDLIQAICDDVFGNEENTHRHEMAS